MQRTTLCWQCLDDSSKQLLSALGIQGLEIPEISVLVTYIEGCLGETRPRAMLCARCLYESPSRQWWTWGIEHVVCIYDKTRRSDGFPFILLGILRMKRKIKKEKERGLVSSLHPLNSFPQVVVAFETKISRALKRAEITNLKAWHEILCAHVKLMLKYTVFELKSEFHKLVSF